MELPHLQWPEGKAWPGSEAAEVCDKALRDALFAVGASFPVGDAEAEAEEEEEAVEV